jgi:hypothetical protein
MTGCVVHSRSASLSSLWYIQIQCNLVTQFVPQRKHKAHLVNVVREMVAVYYENHTGHIWEELRVPNAKAGRTYNYHCAFNRIYHKLWCVVTFQRPLVNTLTYKPRAKFLRDGCDTLFETIILGFVHRQSLLETLHFRNWFYFHLQEKRTRKNIYSLKIKVPSLSSTWYGGCVRKQCNTKTDL